MHIVELSTAVGLGRNWYKVTNASLTENQCLQCCNSGLNACWDTVTVHACDATELNNDVMIKLGDIHYQTEPNLSIFPKEI